jgi:hypothetical protein
MEIHIPPMLAAQYDFPSGPLKGFHNIFDPRLPFEIYTFQETISTNNLWTTSVLTEVFLGMGDIAGHEVIFFEQGP